MKTQRERRGAAAIEFAMVLPVLLALLFGIIEYGWIFFQQSNILAAAREGARYGVTFEQAGSPTPTSAAQARVATVLDSYGISSGTATITATQSGSTPSEVLTVQVVVPYTPLIGLVPTPDNLTGQMTMLLELQD
jgi:Flp pilus assembly protein TadG